MPGGARGGAAAAGTNCKVRPPGSRGIAVAGAGAAADTARIIAARLSPRRLTSRARPGGGSASASAAAASSAAMKSSPPPPACGSARRCGGCGSCGGAACSSSTKARSSSPAASAYGSSPSSPKALPPGKARTFSRFRVVCIFRSNSFSSPRERYGSYPSPCLARTACAGLNVSKSLAFVDVLRYPSTFSSFLPAESGSDDKIASTASCVRRCLPVPKSPWAVTRLALCAIASSSSMSASASRSLSSCTPLAAPLFFFLSFRLLTNDTGANPPPSSTFRGLLGIADSWCVRKAFCAAYLAFPVRVP